MKQTCDKAVTHMSSEEWGTWSDARPRTIIISLCVVLNRASDIHLCVDSNQQQSQWAAQPSTYTHLTDKLHKRGNQNLQIADSICVRIYLIYINKCYIFWAAYGKEMQAEFCLGNPHKQNNQVIKTETMTHWAGLIRLRVSINEAVSKLLMKFNSIQIHALTNYNIEQNAQHMKPQTALKYIAFCWILYFSSCE